MVNLIILRFGREYSRRQLLLNCLQFSVDLYLIQRYCMTGQKQLINCRHAKLLIYLNELSLFRFA